jgi:zinc D-Ala-D-Ala carboxypeptidase
MKKNISQNITYAEATKNPTAIRLGLPNDPNEVELGNMQNIADKVFEKVRTHFFNKYGKPLAITSFFRSKDVNAKIKGSSKTSLHLTGEAIDIDADVFGGPTNAEIFHFIKDNLEFEELIWEYGNDENPDWVHVALKRNGKNQREILRCIRTANGPVYKAFNQK